MKLRVGLGLMAAGLLLASGVSYAKDYCINFGSGSFVVIGRGFTIPPRGKCKAWIGFSAQNGKNQPSSGVGCTSSDKQEMVLTFTTVFPDFGDDFEEDQMIVSLPSQSVSDFFTSFHHGSGGSGTATGTGSVCNGGAIPTAATAATGQHSGPGLSDLLHR